MIDSDFLAYVDQATQNPLGHYSLFAATGALTGLSANAPFFSFRWADAGSVVPAGTPQRPRLAVLLNVDIGAVVTTAFTNGQSVDAELIVARAFSASDTGGTALTPSRARAEMGASLVTDCRMASNGALTPGSRTLDAVGFGGATIYTQNTAGCGDMQQSVYGVESRGVHPVIFRQNEGFLGRIKTAQGAAGVVSYFIAVSWAEIWAYPFE